MGRWGLGRKGLVDSLKVVFFFLFLAAPLSVRDLSPQGETKSVSLHWEHRVLATRAAREVPHKEFWLPFGQLGTTEELQAGEDIDLCFQKSVALPWWSRG